MRTSTGYSVSFAAKSALIILASTDHQVRGPPGLVRGFHKVPPKTLITPWTIQGKPERSPRKPSTANVFATFVSNVSPIPAKLFPSPSSDPYLAGIHPAAQLFRGLRAPFRKRGLK
jgi:hypothetical protein